MLARRLPRTLLHAHPSHPSFLPPPSRKLKKDLEGIDTSNIIAEGGRRRGASHAATAPSASPEQQQQKKKAAKGDGGKKAAESEGSEDEMEF